jgi:hypothetical protein
MKAKPASYYDEAYFRGGPNLGYLGPYAWESAPWERLARAIVRTFGCNLNTTSITDFGCARGFVLWFMKHQFGWQTKGYDFSEYAVANAAPDLDITVADLSKRMDTEPTDIVLCMDTLEHIEERKLKIALENLHDTAKVAVIVHVYVSDGLQNGIDLPEHVTVKPKTWWHELFLTNGFITHVLDPYYKTMIKRLARGVHGDIWADNAFVLEPVQAVIESQAIDPKWVVEIAPEPAFIYNSEPEFIYDKEETVAGLS